MALIPVMNPPHRRKRGRTTHKRRAKRTRRVSSKSLAALARINRLRKSAKRSVHKTSRRRTKRRSRRRFGAGVHRPVIRVKAGRIYRARKRPDLSMIAPKSTFANPFDSQMLLLGNPRRRKGTVSRRRKSTMSRKRRRSHRIYRNPISAGALLAKPKQMLQKDFISEAGSAAAGFIGATWGLQYIPAQFRDTPVKVVLSKVAVVTLLSTGASFINQRIGRAVLLGGGMSLLLDVYQMARGMMGPSAAAPAGGTSAYYGPGINAYYGPGINGMGQDGQEMVTSDTTLVEENSDEPQGF